MPSCQPLSNFISTSNYSPRRRLASTSRRPVAVTNIAGNAEEGDMLIANRQQILHHHSSQVFIDIADAKYDAIKNYDYIREKGTIPLRGVGSTSRRPSSITIAEVKNYPKMISKKEAMMKMVGLLPSVASFAVLSEA